MTEYTEIYTKKLDSLYQISKWTYKNGDLLCEITKLKRGGYEIFACVRKSNRHEICGVEYAPNLHDAKRIAREFVES